MLRIKFGAREWHYDEAAPLSMGEIVMLREMGSDPATFGDTLTRLGEMASADISVSEGVELAEALAKVAFLAEVRENHDARWRDFIWTISLDDLQAFEISNDEAPAPNRAARRAKPAVKTSEVGAALAAARKPAAKAPAKRTTTRKSPRAAARVS